MRLFTFFVPHNLLSISNLKRQEELPVSSRDHFNCHVMVSRSSLPKHFASYILTFVLFFICSLTCHIRIITPYHYCICFSFTCDTVLLYIQINS